MASTLMISLSLLFMLAFSAHYQVTATQIHSANQKQAPTSNSLAGQMSKLTHPAEGSAMNLIPVDQPVTNSYKEFESEPVVELANSKDLRHNQQDSNLLYSTGQLSELDNFNNGNQNSMTEDVGSSTSEQIDANEQQHESAADVSQQQVSESSGKSGARQLAGQQLQMQPGVERRLGLFKKGSHYGSPMNSNYAAIPFMSDCDRCLANLGSPNGDLQQLDQIPSVQPMVPTQTGPGSHLSSFNTQPFSPLKNKLFMKFPFFVKPMSFGESFSSGGQMGAYWPHHHYQQPISRPVAPISSNALYLRPGPAYNCIQTNPPLIAAASNNQDVAPLTKTSSKSYPHQQTTYSSSQY